MAKDQFKTKATVKRLCSRFGVLPLIDKGEELLCVDANFKLLMVKRWKIDSYSEFALSETFDKATSEEAQDAAKKYLPDDPKKVSQLINYLKKTGPDGFEDKLQKMMGN